MISQTNRIVYELKNLGRADRNITATITVRITTPKAIDADKACRKFIKKALSKFEHNFKDFAKDVDKDCGDLDQ